MEELIEFYHARDLFVGRGYYPKKQDIGGALKRLRKCHHEEAKYVCSLFPKDLYIDGNDIRVYQIFVAQGEHPVALCYAGILGHARRMIEKAAQMGHPFAQGLMISYTSDLSRFEWTQKAALGGDRSGLCQLATCFEYGIHTEMNHTQALMYYKQSAELEDVAGMFNYAQFAFEKSDPQRYRWLGRKAQLHQHNDSFLCEISEHLNVYLYSQNQGNVPVLFMIGSMLKGYINYDKKQVFGEESKMYYTACCITLDHYHMCIQRAQKATLSWMWTAKQMGIYRDVARLIGILLWRNRVEWY